MERDLRSFPGMMDHDRGVCYVIAAGVSAVGSIAGGLISSSGNQAAADTANQRYQQTRKDLAPYTKFGAEQLPTLNNLLTGNPIRAEGTLEGLPGYQFNLTQGLKSVESGASARGLGVSGAAQKGAATFATGLANSTYGDQINRLMAGATLGENAGAQTGATGASLAATQASAQSAAGNSLASGITGGIQQFAPYAQQGFNSLFGAGGGAGGGAFGGAGFAGG